MSFSLLFLMRCSPGSASRLAVLSILFLAVEVFLRTGSLHPLSHPAPCYVPHCAGAFCVLIKAQQGLEAFIMFEGILSALEVSWGGEESVCVCVYMYMSVHGYVFPHTESVDSCPVSHSDHTSPSCSNYPLCL